MCSEWIKISIQYYRSNKPNIILYFDEDVSPLFETRVEGSNLYHVTHDWKDLITRNIIKLIKGFYDLALMT